MPTTTSATRVAPLGAPLAAVARFYARRAMAVGGHTYACDPRERLLAEATLRADDAAHLAEQAVARGDWRRAMEHMRDARAFASAAFDLSRR